MSMIDKILDGIIKADVNTTVTVTKNGVAENQRGININGSTVNIALQIPQSNEAARHNPVNAAADEEDDEALQTAIQNASGTPLVF